MIINKKGNPAQVLSKRDHIQEGEIQAAGQPPNSAPPGLSKGSSALRSRPASCPSLLGAP